MKKQDIERDALYVVDPPTSGENGRVWGRPPWKVKARAVAVGVPRANSTRLDGVRLRLEEDVFRAMAYVAGGYRELRYERGHEWTAATSEVERPWDAVKDGGDIEAARRERYERTDGVVAAVSALGLAADDYDLTSETFTMDAGAFLRWLKRIDPVSAAADALVFVNDRRPFHDESEYGEAVDAAMQELREGLRVTDAELTVRGEAHRELMADAG